MEPRCAMELLPTLFTYPNVKIEYLHNIYYKISRNSYLFATISIEKMTTENPVVDTILPNGPARRGDTILPNGPARRGDTILPNGPALRGDTILPDGPARRGDTLIESQNTMCNEALKVLESSINSKTKTRGIFQYIQEYLESSKNGSMNNALLTGSAVTRALCKSISTAQALIDPSLRKEDWDFNDIDIVSNNEFSVVVLFRALYKWAANLDILSDSVDSQQDQYYNPPKITYVKSQSYPEGTLGPKMNIRSTHKFTIDSLVINLIVISGSPYDFIKAFDLPINQVYYDGAKITINQCIIYKYLATREFPALYRTYNRSTWAITLERIEKYRKRGFMIRLSQSIVIDKPNDNGVLPKSRLKIIDRYYNVKMVYEPINAIQTPNTQYSSECIDNIITNYHNYGLPGC